MSSYNELLYIRASSGMNLPSFKTSTSFFLSMILVWFRFSEMFNKTSSLCNLFAWTSSTKHAPAEVRPAPPTRHAHHDAPSHGSGTTYCSTEPCLLCPVLYLQPAAVHQSAAGPADDALPVTGKIYSVSASSEQYSLQPRRLLYQGPYVTITVTLVSSVSAGSLYLSQLFTSQPFVWQMPAVQQLDWVPAWCQHDASI